MPGSAAAAVPWRFVPVALAVLAGTLYLWNLTISGYANTYYSAAAQAGSQSWSAWFYGAIDAGGFITVDKPPVSLWLSGLSVRLLGLSPFAVLLPQAVAGVGAVLLLWDAVRRQLGREAALIAGIAFALTPAATLMFRYNNPDAVLTLLLVAAAWALVRGLEAGRLRWALLASVLVGLAFLTKYLQAYLVLPAFALAWLVAAPGGVARRIGVLLASGLTVLAASAWWVAIVDLVPAVSRPYIGGSTNNTALDLVLGYDGLGRVFGGAGGGPGGRGGGPGGAFGGEPGLLRMFNGQWAGQISWLLPSAAAGLVVGLVARLRAPRTDPRRAGFLLWGTWMVVHVIVFSLMSGIAHPYYAVAIAPAAAALTGGGLAELWRVRGRVRWAGIAVAAILVAGAWWGWQVLERTPDFWPGVGMGAVFVAVAAGILAVASFVVDDPRAPAIGRVAFGVGVAVLLVGPLLYSIETVDTAIAGGDPAPGPEGGAFGGRGGFGGGAPGGVPGDAGGTDGALAAWLLDHHAGETWLVAVNGANEAGPLQVATGVPVMAMGGFMGSDPAPTLEQLQAHVREGRLRYVLLGGRGGFGGPAGPGGFAGGDGQGNVAVERSDWVTSACVAVSGVSASLYDCTGAG
ncbi:MAG TPA: glycosyltransferase family 39 protein [Candidatus Limnocylindrales bacterium]|nr:glycosyltransferase family 39 protein [Candidatus Limnocylindrales bacterium]